MAAQQRFRAGRTVRRWRAAWPFVLVVAVVIFIAQWAAIRVGDEAFFARVESRCSR